MVTCILTCNNVNKPDDDLRLVVHFCNLTSAKNINHIKTETSVKRMRSKRSKM